jgi:hypothetical protein
MASRSPTCRPTRSNLKKRLQKANREKRFTDLENARNLIDWLNLTRASDLHGMVRDLQSLDLLSKDVWSLNRERKIQALASTVNEGMRKCGSFFLALHANESYLVPHGPKQPLEIRRLRPNNPPYEMVRHPVTSPGEEPIDLHRALAYRAFEEVVRTGCVSKIKICDVDQRWFCQKAKNQNYCSNPCRKRKYRDSPSYRAWRKKNNDVQNRRNPK